MRKIEFTKMVASGNDFVVVENRPPSTVYSPQSLAKEICKRQFGVGADGMLVLEKSRIADIKMRIFNADGSEAQMCGNGARCVALYISAKRKAQSAKRKAQSAKLNIETKAGIIASQVDGDNVRIKLTDPQDIKLNLPIKINNCNIKVNFINTGVPHVVIFTEGLDKIDVVNLGRYIRYHKRFAPKGTNVNFIEALNKGSFKIRTYERGVEGETLACGTGCVAAALIFALKTKQVNRINAHTKSRETLKIYFKKQKERFNNVWLEGKARLVYKGVYYV